MLKYGAKYNYAIVEEGEWWRMIAAGFEHGNYEHILWNMVFIIPFMYFNEMVLGHFQVFAVYILSVIGGNMLGSVLEDYWSLGASTAVLGMAGCTTAIIALNF